MPVTYECSGSIACIRFEHGVTNALTTEVLDTLRALVGRAVGESRGILLAGGEKFFCNGVDLPWALEQSPAQVRSLFLTLGETLLALLECPLPVVGAARGHATGAGLALLLGCDYRHGALGRVLLGKPEVRIGVPNPYYGDQLFRFVAGDFIASDLIYTGALVTAEKALEQGWVHSVTAADEVEPTARERLAQLAELNPEAFAESKRMRLGHLCADIRVQLSARVARQVEIWNSEEAQVRLRAAAQRLQRSP